MHEFEIVRKLSDGVFAELLLARTRNTHQSVVLEVMRPELKGDRAWIDSFLREAKQRRALVHPAFPKRVGGGKTLDGRLYVASEPVGATDLRTLLTQRGRLHPMDIVRLIAPLCDGLSYLHERGLAHGYLRPENIFWSEGRGPGALKLLDFGLAFFRGGRPRWGEARPLVEAEYLSPERVQGTRANAYSDVYALGVLIYELAVGAPPFRGASDEETRQLHLTEAPEPLPDAAKALQPIVDRCLAKRPQQRYRTVEELKQALLALSPRAPDEDTEELTQIDLPALDAGLELGSYEVTRLLGEGSMGRVYQARHKRLGRQVAIKLMRPELALSRTFVERFFQEARAVNQINHEHIVQISDLVDDASNDRHVFLVMELLQGADFAELLRREPIRVARAVGIARQVASALHAAHQVGVVHRDVKPDNIFVTQRGGRDFVKVLDFGVAKLMSTAAQAPVSGTLDGVVVGTPAYMAPEQAEGRADAGADIYSLGVVLYKALSGRAPFEARSFGELLVRIFHEPPPPLPEQTPWGEPIPAGLRRLVMQCLEKKPSRRPATMALLSEALAPFERADDPRAPLLKAPARWLERWRALPASTRGTMLGSAAAFAVLVGLVAAYWPTRPTRLEVAPVLSPAQDAPSAIARIALKSTPPGARVIRADTRAPLGFTPLLLELPAAQTALKLRFERPGYQAAERTISQEGDAALHVTLKKLDARPAKKTAKPRPAPQEEPIHRDDVLDPFAQ